MKYEIGLLSKLVAFDTVTDRKKEYAKCADFIAREARKLGLKAKLLKIRDEKNRQCPHVLIERNAGAKETLLVLCHYDVVPAGPDWSTDPFKVVKKSNKLFGRGTGDNKGAIVVALSALRGLKGKKLKRNVKVVVSADEEIGGAGGLESVVKKYWKKIKADKALVMDTSSHKINIGCSGIISGYLDFGGKAGHAGYPFKTPNIIHNALPFLNELKEYSKIRESVRSKYPAGKDFPHKKMFGRFSITVLNAGEKTNIIPGSLRVGFDIRLIPEENAKKVMKNFKAFVNCRAKKYSLKPKITMEGGEGHATKPNNPFVMEAARNYQLIAGRKPDIGVMGGTEDGRLIAKKGIPIVVFAPGGETPHGSNEYITLDSIKLSKEMLKQLLV